MTINLKVNDGDQPSLVAAEASLGPTGAAIVNAVANTRGKRLRDLPPSAQKMKAALG